LAIWVCGGEDQHLNALMLTSMFVLIHYLYYSFTSSVITTISTVLDIPVFTVKPKPKETENKKEK
jgi:hypothetical protein